MTTRERISMKIKIFNQKIENLNTRNLELLRRSYLLCDDKQQYREQTRTTGIGKNKKTYLEGRIYWMQQFKDEDTGRSFDAERSRAVRIDGEWI